MNGLRKFKSIGLIIFLVNVSIVGWNQKKVYPQNNAWLVYIGNHSIAEKWSLKTVYAFRRHDFFSQWQQSLSRLTVNYKLNSKVSLSLGGDWCVTFPYGESPISYKKTEFRSLEQLTLKNSVYRIKIVQRYRLEQRYIEDAHLNEDNMVVRDGFYEKNRIRYRLLMSIPINHQSFQAKTFYLTAFEEVFLGLGKNIQQNIMDQNRTAFLLGYEFNPKFKIEMGYLNQILVRSNGIDMELNHTLNTNIKYNIDFTTHHKTKKTDNHHQI